MNNPLVSIIIPVYNAEKYIAETINSALNQTWANKEIIIVDDGSTDQSLKIASSFNSPYISVFTQENKGASAARNKGLKEAKGDYIQFLDADDLLHPDKISLQIKAINNTPKAIAHGRYVNFFDEDNKDILPLEYHITVDYQDALDFLYDLYGGNNNTTHAGGMVPQHSWLTPRNVIDTAGHWNTDLTVDDDGEFFCRIVLNSKEIKYVENAVCYYRRHRQTYNLSAQISYQSLLSTFESIKLKQKHIGNIIRMNTLFANQAMHLLVNTYPNNRNFYKQVKQFIDDMGGNTWLPYEHGTRKFFRKLLGWKMMRWLSYYKHLNTY